MGSNPQITSSFALPGLLFEKTMILMVSGEGYGVRYSPVRVVVVCAME